MVGLFVILLGSAYFFYSRLEKIQETTDVLLEGPEGKTIPVNENSPVRKSTLSDISGAVYELEGNYVEKPEYTNGFVRGKFIIKNDPLKREIDLIAGDINGKVFYGIYENIAQRGTTWSMVSTDVIAELITPDDNIRLMIVLQPLPEDSSGYVEKQIRLLDTLALEFNNKVFEVAIPEDMTIMINRIGVVK